MMDTLRLPEIIFQAPRFATMVGYAGACAIVALGVDICHFNDRDL